METIHLFGIPYAGGSAAATYGRWASYLPERIKVCPLEAAGRGRRMAEPFHDRLQSAAADMLESVAAVAGDAPYAVYGHSMGTALAYELVKAADRSGLAPPRKLFLSGRYCPHHRYRRRNLHLLQDEPFLEEIRSLGGTPDEFFQLQDLVAAFLPVLRSDYRMMERYEAEVPVHVTAADIEFFWSNNDPLVDDRSGVEGWRGYTKRSFRAREFDGGHFFINDRTSEVCQAIAAAL